MLKDNTCNRTSDDRYNTLLAINGWIKSKTETVFTMISIERPRSLYFRHKVLTFDLQRHDNVMKKHNLAYCNLVSRMFINDSIEELNIRYKLFQSHILHSCLLLPGD